MSILEATTSDPTTTAAPTTTTAAAVSGIVFQDSFGFAANTQLDAIGYVPTALGGGPGTGSWLGDTNNCGRITAANRVVRSSGGGSGNLSLASLLPPNRLYSVKADLYVASTATDNDRTFLISHYNTG